MVSHHRHVLHWVARDPGLLAATLPFSFPFKKAHEKLGIKRQVITIRNRTLNTFQLSFFLTELIDKFNILSI